MKNKNQSGFIPMLIMIALVLTAVIWMAYKHVSSLQK